VRAGEGVADVPSAIHGTAPITKDSNTTNNRLTKHINGARSLGGVTAFTWGALRRGGGVALRRGGGSVASAVIIVAGLLAGTGWLYLLRGLHWLRVGPRIPDALPLLQLAASDGQPLLRVLVAWILAGALTGVAMAEVGPSRRAALALAIALGVLLGASQASYALARNVAFSSTVFSRTPGLGPVLEACAFALGCWLPRPADRGQRPRARRWSLVSVISGLDDRGVGGGERRHAGQDTGDRQPVQHARDSART
jgi:hypothetical protein